MIQFYKLVSGESIVARQVKKTKTEIEIELPIQILEVYGDETEDGESAYVFSPWLPFSETLTVRLSKNAIILATSVNEEMVLEYGERVDRYLNGDEEETFAPEPEPESPVRRKCSTGTGGFRQLRKRRVRWPSRRF